MNDDQKALLLVGALLFGAGNGTGFTGGRMTAPVPPAEVRIVHVQAPAAAVSAKPDAIEPEPAAPPSPPRSVAPAEPPPIIAARPPEAKPPLPAPRPKIAEPKPRPKAEKPVAKKPRPPAPSSRGLPSCAVVKREYERMTWSEKMAAYRKSTAEQIAHGRRCLGL